MTIAIADPTPVLLAAIYADPATVAAVTHVDTQGNGVTAIYGGSLPLDPTMDAQIPNVAASAIVLTMQAGPVDPYTPVSYPRAALRVYHRTRTAARALWFQVAPLLHNQSFRQADGRAVNVSLASTPQALLEPDTLFPFCEGFFVCQVVGTP